MKIEVRGVVAVVQLSAHLSSELYFRLSMEQKKFGPTTLQR